VKKLQTLVSEVKEVWSLEAWKSETSQAKSGCVDRHEPSPIMDRDERMDERIGRC